MTVTTMHACACAVLACAFSSLVCMCVKVFTLTLVQSHFDVCVSVDLHVPHLAGLSP